MVLFLHLDVLLSSDKWLTILFTYKVGEKGVNRERLYCSYEDCGRDFFWVELGTSNYTKKKKKEIKVRGEVRVSKSEYWRRV